MANINQHQVRQVTVFQGVAEIARAEGVHKSYISKILHGKAAGNPRLRMAIARAGLPLPRTEPRRASRTRPRRRASVAVGN